jgi:hypothetical protein
MKYKDVIASLSELRNWLSIEMDSPQWTPVQVKALQDAYWAVEHARIDVKFVFEHGDHQGR